MRQQNETFRRLGRGPFGDLLRAMLRDPALLVWLDAPSNRKGKPNENLARELMELFTLGVGRYTESDVKETARALTGLTVAQGQFQVRADHHDDGEKTILGKTARFDGDSLADHLLAQPAAADRLAWRLCATFLGEGVADASARGEPGGPAPARRPARRPGGGDDPPLDLFFSDQQPARPGRRPGRLRRRLGAGPRAVRPAAQHAAAGRVDRPAGSGAVLPAQRRRLARRAELAVGPGGRGAGQFRRGAGRRAGWASTRPPSDLRGLAARHGRRQRTAEADRASSANC